MKIELLPYPFHISQFKDYVWQHFRSYTPFALIGELLVPKGCEPNTFYNHHYGSWESRCQDILLCWQKLMARRRLFFRKKNIRTFLISFFLIFGTFLKKYRKESPL